LTLFCVDPYLEYEKYEAERTTEQMNRYEEIAKSRLAEFGGRAQMMKMTSIEAAPNIPDGSLDFVFIDALHTYDAVTQDIGAWFDKVRSGGLVAGHDYRWDGVQQAVHEFQAKLGMEGFFTPPASDIWFFVRP
jgi:predicted O-methyltransferase YrrM